MHLHLDLTGGIAGDMFVAAMLDAFDELRAPLFAALAPLAAQHQFSIDTASGCNGGISGTRFSVMLNHQPEPQQHHPHYHWADIQNTLINSPLEDPVKQHALGIFTHLAQAEAKIHGVSEAEVAFHEVGAWDCIADIVSAAWLIVHSGATSWSASKFPWGGGHVKCAHGLIPVPAPATLNLLKGYQFFDDGVKGERITPTGAAILAWLAPSQNIKSGSLSRCGYGLGTKQFAALPNILRISVLESAENDANWQHEQMAVIQCDIDDMTGEMLAIAREQLRQMPEVLEVTEASAHGKKQRFIQTLTLLCRPQAVTTVCNAIFRQTSTLGLRYWLAERLSLPRELSQHEGYQIKTVQRPGGTISCKIEADELQQCSDFHSRQQLKRTIEQDVEHHD